MITQVTHATSERRLEKILACGEIRPRGDAPGNWEHTIESNPQTVYLSCAYAAAFASHATDDRDGQWAFISFDIESLDLKNLVADEDALEQAMRGHDDIEGDMIARTRYYRDLAFNNKGLYWAESLKAMGTMGHVGAISVSAACRISLFDHMKNFGLTLALSDHTPSAMLYQVMAEKLTNESRWIAGLDEIYQESAYDQAIAKLWPEGKFNQAMKDNTGLRSILPLEGIIGGVKCQIQTT